MLNEAKRHGVKFSGNSKQRRVARRAFEREKAIWGAMWETTAAMWNDEGLRKIDELFGSYDNVVL